MYRSEVLLDDLFALTSEDAADTCLNLLQLDVEHRYSCAEQYHVCCLQGCAGLLCELLHIERHAVGQCCKVSAELLLCRVVGDIYEGHVARYDPSILLQVREVAQSVKPYVTTNTVVVNVGKGFEESTEKRLSEVLKEELPNNPIVVLTGPSHAEEVARNFPTTVVCASDDKASTEYIQDTLQNDRFRIYANSDMVGCEIGGAMKNAIALCCGIIEGIGLGDNTLAAIMTRGLAEITRLGVAMGGKRETFNGLSGIGDLIVTCTSTHSRNHRAGLLIGDGMPAEDAVARVGTVEGYNVAIIAQRIARRLGVTTPIIDQLCGVCYEGQNPRESISRLMTRPSRAEEEIF